jgi:hypothetical protein
VVAMIVFGHVWGIAPSGSPLHSYSCGPSFMKEGRFITRQEIAPSLVPILSNVFQEASFHRVYGETTIDI